MSMGTNLYFQEKSSRFYSGSVFKSRARCDMVRTEKLFIICAVDAVDWPHSLGVRCSVFIGCTSNFVPSSQLSGVSELRDPGLSGFDCTCRPNSYDLGTAPHSREMNDFSRRKEG